MDRFSSSIRVRMIAVILPLVLIPLICVLIATSILTGASIRTYILNQMDDTNRQINSRFDLLTNQMEDIMRRMIVNEDVQQSLTKADLSHAEMHDISTFLSWYLYGGIRYIVYQDNNGNLIQTHEMSSVTTENVKKSHINQGLAGTYAKQVWTFHEDDLSGDFAQALFITRYIRHLELNLTPGLLIFRLDPRILEDIFDPRVMVSGADYYLLDQYDSIVYGSRIPGTAAERQAVIVEFREYLSAEPTQNIPAAGRRIRSVHVNQRTGWKIFSVISYRAAMMRLRNLQLIIYIIMVGAAIGTVAVVYLSARRFTQPIRELEYAMHSFRDGNFAARVEISRTDEIGEMGKSFNLMADEIGTLIDGIRREHEALAVAELESLAYQINPHFIYNTLDNAHMLARSSGDTRLSTLIISLTKFLRISLSKGHTVIHISDEFDHVENYLNIQRIRYGDLFDFHVGFDQAIGGLEIVKFALQPLVENCIQHGFRDKQSGGVIEIRGTARDRGAEIKIIDNGCGMKSDVLAKLNRFSDLSNEEILEAFPTREGGYGIGNVVARLNLHHGPNYSIRFESDGDSGASCTLRIFKPA